MWSQRTAGFVVALFFVIVAGVVGAVMLGASSPAPLDPPPGPDTLAQLDALLSLYANNPDCILPCFWGFRPGQTPVDDVAAFLSVAPDDRILDPAHGIDYGYTVPGRTAADPAFSLDFTLDDHGVLDLMEVVMLDMSAWLPVDTYELAHVLTMTGVPTEVYLSIRSSAARVYLSLLYDKARAVITYAFRLDSDREADGPFMLCYGREASDSVLFRLSAHERDASRDGVRSDALRNSIIPLEDLTGLDTAAFTRYVITHPGECLALLSRAQMQARGFRY